MNIKEDTQRQEQQREERNYAKTRKIEIFLTLKRCLQVMEKKETLKVINIHFSL